MYYVFLPYASSRERAERAASRRGRRAPSTSRAAVTAAAKVRRGRQPRHSGPKCQATGNGASLDGECEHRNDKATKSMGGAIPLPFAARS
ncbi:uncharacterized protein SETTUDRAFT_163227 [Exserohilum turcica Et28A]|uniref:Uncharacterized protein n=1 Tax=Exserohilum turcicum (strain 28A) TaxID=671987 RepID=R0K248_EXST2|nr:uncharacterized protein SETTUDRAFT_163227 [Exserohilum turcica Et28A]EOA87213.1 hypothetical protein SETTUDRAFT_163227 [Exserohilum turcica Et28A]